MRQLKINKNKKYRTAYLRLGHKKVQSERKADPNGLQRTGNQYIQCSYRKKTNTHLQLQCESPADDFKKLIKSTN